MVDFNTVLVSNRGEIAVRVIRAARDAGLRSVAIYAEPDARAPHVRLADAAWPLGGQSAGDSYLDMDKVLDVAKQSGADAVHPGYGFLSENADFAQAVIDAGLVWIGPSPRVIRELGDKVTARRIAEQVGAPLVPGTPEPVDSAAEILAFADEHGLPVAIKAAFGGGGHGLKVATTREEIPELFEAATREAVTAFGRGECFAERYLERPRHVEAQVLADEHDTVVVVGTRDCSLQRRHQKLVEEAPAPLLSEQQRATIRHSAADICRAAGYTGAGTVEYLVAVDGTISFLEVNTRLQVEHPVTEETTGIDLVLEQFRIARGDPMTLTSDPEPRGHAIEFRINGEDPARGFVPTPGTITELKFPAGPGVRVDSGIETGTVIGGQFDSMLAKLIVTGPTRAAAIHRAIRALDEMVVDGLTTVLPFHRAVIRDPAFTTEFSVHTRWIETESAGLPAAGEKAGETETVTVFVGTQPLRVRLPGLRSLTERAHAIREDFAAAASGSRSTGVASNKATTPMQGTLVKIAVAEGDRVSVGDLIAVIEAMKMENPVLAHRSGIVRGLTCTTGTAMAQDSVLCEIVDETNA